MSELSPLDAIAPAAYVAVIGWIGYRCRPAKAGREDYLLGGRRSGRFVQCFAWFSQASTPDGQVGVATATFHNGIAGVWTSLMMVFATPILWIAAPWMRRLRVLTMGDFYLERYGSRSMAAWYALIATLGMMCVLAAGDVAVAKTTLAMTGAPWTPTTVIWLVCVITLMNVLLGGLTAAFHAMVVQGIVVLAATLLLLAAGFSALAHGPGLRQRLPADFLQVFGSPRLPDFTWYYIAMLSLTAGMTVVTQPQFLVTTGAARDESAARVGVIGGTLLKRVCTILWGVIGLIAVALFAPSVSDPDSVWGYAARELLAPMRVGLLGLMLVAMVCALTATSNAMMLSASGLLTQNLYRLIRPGGSERADVAVARVAGVLFICGAALVATQFSSLFALLKLNWEFFVIFAGAFWLGLKWRRANRKAAWASILVTFFTLYAIPAMLPWIAPSLRTAPLTLEVTDAGASIYWSQGIDRNHSGRAVGHGYPYLDLLALRVAGFDLRRNSNALNETVRLGLRLALPFFVLVVVACCSNPDDPALIERFFARMRTPVVPGAGVPTGPAPHTMPLPTMELIRPGSNFELYRWHPRDVLSLFVTLLFVAGIVALLIATVSLIS